MIGIKFRVSQGSQVIGYETLNDSRWFISADGQNWADGTYTPYPGARPLKRWQYTGLKDKNDIEIYRGDIVNNGVHNTSNYSAQNFAVFWNDVSACWDLENSAVNLAEGEPSKRYEVIGNIYENPELLI